MHKLPAFITALLALSLIAVKTVNAQSPSPSPSGGTLPQTGIETPLLLISGGGLSLLGSGFLLRKLQKR